jgi:glycosyltransferase involved in cell wall biosynthesis
MKDPSKKVVIEMGVDESPFLPHIGDTRKVITVGHSIGKRWDKGHCQYVTTHFFIPSLALIGPGNEGMPGAMGTVQHKELMEIYSHSRIYFNPGPIIGLSVAEAMMAGLPVVTFRPINLKDLVVDGINGFVTDTVDGAVMRINKLLADQDLAFRMGCAAKASARRVFSSNRFIDRWNMLFMRVVGK